MRMLIRFPTALSFDRNMQCWGKVRRSGLSASVVLLAALTGCATPQNPLPDYIPPPQPSNKPSDTYCAAMEVNARRYARRQTALAWTLGVLSVASISAGAIMVATADSPSRKQRIISLSLPALGAILGYGASASFARAKDHGDLASAASLALNNPEESVKLCNQALASWNENRSGASAALIAALQAKTEAEKATKVADKAKADVANIKAKGQTGDVAPAGSTKNEAQQATKAADQAKKPATKKAQ